MRYLIKFKKGEGIKYVSHLDVMRSVQRTFNRAGLPVSYSKGFNPHMKLSLTQPLSVGVYSVGDYLDIEFDIETDEEEIKNKFNGSSNKNLEILKVVKIRENYDAQGRKIKPSMAAVDYASYRVNIKYDDISKLKDELEELLKCRDWEIMKKTKSGEKEVNIRPMVKYLNYKVQDNVLKIDALLCCGSRSNLSADLMAKYIKLHTSSSSINTFTEIVRIEMYGIKAKKIIPLSEYFAEYTN